MRQEEGDRKERDGGKGRCSLVFMLSPSVPSPTQVRKGESHTAPAGCCGNYMKANKR